MSGRAGAAGPSLFSRVVARAFDRLSLAMERRGPTADHRRAVCGEARGLVLEVGAGTGLNFRFYPPDVRVVALEPGEALRRIAEPRARATALPVRLVAGSAHRLPFPDAAFDTVVASLVLCSVRDQERGLSELRRVIKPGGRLRFYEHVRAGDPRAARRQDFLDRPWGAISMGCHPNRDSVAAIEAAGFRVTDLDRFDLPDAPGFLRPHVLGVAQPA